MTTDNFMQQQVLFATWAEIDTTDGTWFIRLGEIIQARSDLTAPALGKVYTTEEEFAADGLHANDFLVYTEGRRMNSVTIKEGWGARLSAPGFLDCTDWTVFDTEAKAKQHLEELEGE